MYLCLAQDNSYMPHSLSPRFKEIAYTNQQLNPIGDFLLRLAEYMIKIRKFDYPNLEEIEHLLQDFRQNGQDPLGELISSQKVLIDKSPCQHEEPKPAIHFIEEDLLADTFHAFHLKSYEHFDRHTLRNILLECMNSKDHELAISQLIQQMWEDKQIDEICQVDVPDHMQEEYREMFGHAIFQPILDKLNALQAVEQPDFESFNDQVREYSQERLDILLSEEKNITTIARLHEVFIWQLKQYFSDQKEFRCSLTFLHAAQEIMEKYVYDPLSYAWCLCFQSDAAEDAGDQEEALRLLKKVEEVMVYQSDRDANVSEWKHDLSFVYIRLAEKYKEAGQRDLAEQFALASTEMASEAYADRPMEQAYTIALAGSFVQLCDIYIWLDLHSEALSAVNYAIELMDIQLKMEPDNLSIIQQSALAYQAKVSIVPDEEKTDLLRHSIKLQESLFWADPYSQHRFDIFVDWIFVLIRMIPPYTDEALDLIERMHDVSSTHYQLSGALRAKSALCATYRALGREHSHRENFIDAVHYCEANVRFCKELMQEHSDYEFLYEYLHKDLISLATAKLKKGMDLSTWKAHYLESYQIITSHPELAENGELEEGYKIMLDLEYSDEEIFSNLPPGDPLIARLKA